MSMKLLTAVLATLLTYNLYATTYSLPFTTTNKGDVDKVDVTDPMYQIQSVTVEEVETPLVIRDLDDKKGSLDDIAMQLDKLIALGKKVWKIIEDNKPVVTVDFAPSISVIPSVQGEGDPMNTFTMMSGWKAPRAKTYKVTYKNTFGMEVITFEYTVMFQYGGQYEGVGKYLTGVSVFANNIHVMWGFNFNAKTSLVTITNMGLAKDPIAAATLKIDYKTESVVNYISASQIFYVTGAGDIQIVK